MSVLVRSIEKGVVHFWYKVFLLYIMIGIITRDHFEIISFKCNSSVTTNVRFPVFVSHEST